MPPSPVPEPWKSFLSDIDSALTEGVELECIGGFVVTSCSMTNGTQHILAQTTRRTMVDYFHNPPLGALKSRSSYFSAVMLYYYQVTPWSTCHANGFYNQPETRPENKKTLTAARVCSPAVAALDHARSH
jgi:hypothetical protein